MDRQRRERNVLIPCLLLLLLAFCLASYGFRLDRLEQRKSGEVSRSNSSKVPVEVIMQYEALPANNAAKQRHVQVQRNVTLPKPPVIRWPHLPRFLQPKSSSNSSLAVRATSAIMQSTIDYWVDCCTRWSERLGLREDPVLELLRSAARSAVPTEEERKKLQEQREWYYHDSSVFYVMLTLRLGLLGFFLSLFAFESLLQGWIFGDLGQALAVPRLFFSPAKAAELSFQGFGSSLPGGRKPRGYKREVLRQIITGQVPCRLHQLLRRVMTLEDSNIVDSAGMDALILLRFCALCGRFCALTAIWCLVLVPVYSAGRRAEGSLSLYSLSNVPSESWRLWLVVPTAYLCNLTLCGLLWKEYEHFVKLRRHFLGGDKQESAEQETPRGPESQWPSRPLTSRRAASSPSLGPMGSSWGKPYSADNPQNPNFSPELRPVASASFFEPVSPAMDVNSVQVNWSRGVTPPRLLFGGDTNSCQPSGACSPAPWQAAAPSNSYANVSMALVREQARRSVILEQLPRSLRDPGALRSCLDDLLGHNAVLCVSFAPADARRLSEWVEERIKLRSQSTQLSKVLLMRMEDRLAERRDDFARAMTSSRMTLRFGPGPSSFLSVFSLPESVEPNPEPNDRVRRSRTMRHSESTGSFRSSNCLGWASTAMLSCRTGCRALCSSLRTVSWVMREVAGTSLRQVNALVPTSALDTPAQTTTGTPMAGIIPADRQVSFGAVVQEELPSTAFVTFRTLQAACVACQVVLDEDPVRGMGMQVSPAPEPRDVVWHNVARPQTQLLVRQFFVEIALLFGLAFWSVPVSLIQVWCSSERLSALLPGLQLPESMRGTDLEALVTLYMPVLALLALLEILPIMLHRLASRYEGVKSYSALQMRTMRRYWRFQLATIGVTVLSGSLSNSLTAMLDQPTSMLWELGQSLPQVAVYFLATVLSSGLVVGPVSLLRLPLLAQLTWTALTRRLREIFCLPTSAQVESSFLAAAAEDCLDTPPMAADLSALLLVLLVCVTYASIAPLIILAGALFFALRWLVLALRYLYVHVPRFDSGGAFWYLLWDQAVLALILGDVTTLATVALRSGYAQLPFLLPLPLLPVAFRALANFRFQKPSQRLSMRAARMVDARADPNLSERFPLDAYWHPALRHPADAENLQGAVG